MSFRHRQNVVQNHSQIQRQITEQAQKQIAELELVEEEDEGEGEPLKEPHEPDELEDTGDSEVMLDAKAAVSPFDREWISTLPLIGQLPRRARPPVIYRIDETLKVHSLVRRKDRVSELRKIVARAVAHHIRKNGVALRTLGDWCRIPAIMGDAGLMELVPDPGDRDKLARMHHVGAGFKDFALLLPNGDVVTPQALLDIARKGKRATRAAALRSAGQRPDELGGEPWSDNDWGGFEATQRKKRKNQQHGQGYRRRRAPREKKR